MKCFFVFLFSAIFSSCLSKIIPKPEEKAKEILLGRNSEYYCRKEKACKSDSKEVCAFDPNGNVMLTFPNLCVMYNANCNSKHLYHPVDIGLCSMQDDLINDFSYIMDFKVLAKIHSNDLTHAIEVPLPGFLDAETRYDEEDENIRMKRQNDPFDNAAF